MQTLLVDVPVVVAEGLLAQVLADANHIIQGFNSRAVDLLGTEPGGVAFESLFEEALRPEVEAVLGRVAAGVPHHVTWPVRNAAGRLRHCEWHLGPRFKRGGRAVGIEITFVPVEAQRREWRRLHEAQAQFLQIASNVAAMVWVTKADGTIRATNRTWRDFVGEAAAPDAWQRLIHPEDRAFVMERRAAAGGEAPAIYHYRLRRRDGSYRWVEERVLRRADEHGEQQLVGSCNDVTEEREVRGRLEHQVALTEGILNAALDAVITVDERNRIVGFNPAAEQMFGYAAADVIGSDVKVLMPARFRPAHEARTSGFLARGARATRLAAQPGLCGLRSDGSEFPIEASVSSMVTPSGRRITAIVRDMTSYMRALQALQDRESRLRMAMDSANLGSLEVDLATGRLIATEGAARLLGLGDDPAGWVLSQFTQPVHPDDRERVKGILETIVREDRLLDAEVRIVRPDGGVRWIYGRGRLHRDAQGQPRRVVAIIMDIHARKQAEEQLLALSQRLLAAQEDERRHIARELHDQIGQALTAAIINLQMLPPQPESAELHATLASVLQQVRELSLNLRPSMLDSLGLEAALRWYLDRQRALGKFEVELACPDGAARLPAEVETVAFRLVQEAVTNILRHARARHVWVKVERAGDAVTLTVRDDGVGFDPKAVLARASGGGSFGVVGMAERAQLAGGSLKFESVPGGGTTVTAVLPLQRGA